LSVPAGTFGTTARLLPSHRDLIAERTRLPIQRGQPGADKVVIALFMLMFYGLLVFTSLDVFRLHLLGTPRRFVSALGLALFFCGFWIAYLAVRENAFAAIAVKRSDRQTVIDTGIYGVVRHPMYAGSIPLLIGIPLWLQSGAGALAALVPIGTLMVRSILEERFLGRELHGYDAYMRRVRYRVVPGLW
jgi:protein-S-isoprenylcysteine O-methyltransferase Ste14